MRDIPLSHEQGADSLRMEDPNEVCVSRVERRRVIDARSFCGRSSASTREPRCSRTPVPITTSPLQLNDRWPARRSWLAILLFVLVAGSAVTRAQWLNYPTPGIPRLAGGAPDLKAPAP